ncbi:SDR family oxidoreductase [Chryseobacterium turcicum]|uniref:SDR family oxidoreductase n=1 Tax=Chryseobacterium turcicum TaxID=2898076 RepID=A0A9Q3YZ33_9FLAO|nr:SDR family oxidoreductase [Chryseobacterium turcicum]MCD1117585.1 SDR family oxidoreductase [Chryseobacterium turcicum]
MENFKNKNVLITGGAAGIGKIMSRIFLQKGAKVIIWDINQVKIDETVSELSTLGPIQGYQVNVADFEGLKAAFANVKEKHGIVDVLINNAGIVVGKFFHEHTDADIQRSMDINANAPMYITKLFLTDMMAQNSGYICNVASSAGLISNPRMSVYAASKWSVLGWSDSIRLEMKQLKKNIGVTTVTPYYINTGMFDGIRSIVPILEPENVAKKIVRSIERRKPIASMPWSIHFVRFFQGIFPIWFFDWFVGNVMGIYKTMDHFKGH